MMSIESCGVRIDNIDVKISYRIIELFSGNLYSSPNKAFEELVCNSYDAFANNVAVYVPSDLKVDGAYIWVCDDGESMDQQGLKHLWNIGQSLKRVDPKRDAKRLQIGRFGIGKLATYVLANKLTYFCKKNGRYLATTMDYTRISNEKDELTLDEREIKDTEIQEVLNPYIHSAGNNLLPFKLFGEGAAETWTFSILTSLKPKSSEIKEGRLKWVLSTALPLNPGFKLYYNGNEIESSKISKPIRKTWILGKDDTTLDSKDYAVSRQDGEKYFIDFDKLKGVYGQIDLYEDSLVDSSKSSIMGRSHGIFLMVRGRLVNLEDPLLGMDAFSHGAFNRSRIVIHADELDENLTSTRESIKESEPLWQLREYLKSKFNNEVKKFYFDEENRENREKSISYRLSQTSFTQSKRPLYVFAQKFFDGAIINPILIEKPSTNLKLELLDRLKEELLSEDSIIKHVEWLPLNSSDPIAKLDLARGKMKINMLHPYIANYHDAYKKSALPIEYIAITEVLTEAHLYELGIDESKINAIIRRRDETLRKLSLSDRIGAPLVAQMITDAIVDPTGLEDAVYNAFLALGFETTKIGGNGKPDGKADAILGFSSIEKNNNYSLTYDTKSTQKDKIQAATAKLSGIKRHQDDYKADFSVVIAIDYEGSNDSESAISKEAKQQRVTVMRAKDLVRLTLLAAPKQIGLSKLRDLFEKCHSPSEVTEWVDKIQNKDVKFPPIKEILETIYDLQKSDTEPPEISAVRRELHHKSIDISSTELKSLIESLKTFIPGFIDRTDTVVGIQGHPDKIMDIISTNINTIPNHLQQMYLSIFSGEKYENNEK
jgi:hypothetical protein